MVEGSFESKAFYDSSKTQSSSDQWKPLHRDHSILYGEKRGTFCPLTAPADRGSVHMSMKGIQACTVVSQPPKQMTIAGEMGGSPHFSSSSHRKRRSECLVSEDKSNKKKMWWFKNKILYIQLVWLMTRSAFEGWVNQGPSQNLKTIFSVSVDGKTPLMPEFIGLTTTTLSYTGQWGGHKSFYKLV